MNILDEERRIVMEENNTAQLEFVDYLESINGNVYEIRYPEPLHGDVDLSVLEEMGFRGMTAIEFVGGEITSIVNVPESVTSLVCSGNLLESLVLPASLIELRCSDNYISSIDVSKLRFLKVLEIKNNRLSRLENLPQSLESIYCDDNEIAVLVLTDLDRLKTLHCTRNRYIQIHNLPVSVVDLKMDSDPLSQISANSGDSSQSDKSDNDRQGNSRQGNSRQGKDYLETLNDYFKLKSKYERIVRDQKKVIMLRGPTKKLAMKKIAEMKPACIQCKRPVGTLFSRKNNRYIAKCGDESSPCKLDIEIYNGEYNNIYKILKIFKDGTEEGKENIIELKLNTLFNYISEADSIEAFKQEIEVYNLDNSVLKDILKKYTAIFENTDKKELIDNLKVALNAHIDESNQSLTEYQKTDDFEILKSAVDLQITHVFPEAKQLQRMKYATNMTEFDVRTGIWTLSQKPYTLSELDYTFGEPPRVIKYVTETIE